jgi:hypothetical protein
MDRFTQTQADDVAYRISAWRCQPQILNRRLY